MQILRRDRYRDLFTIHLPSLGTLEGRQADVNVVRSFLSQQLNKGKDVLLVGNSYGGTVIGEAVKDFISFSSVSTTPTPPGKGRILGLIFLSGYIPYITEVTQPQTRPDIKTVSPSFFRFNETGRVFWDNDLENYPPSKTFYNLLSAKDAQFWSSRLDFSAFAALNATATYIPYTGDFKCVYAVGLQDNSIPPAFAYTFINQVRTVPRSPSCQLSSFPRCNRMLTDTL